MRVESRLEASSRGNRRAIQWRADPATFGITQVSREAWNILGYPTERWLTELTFWKDHTHAEDWERVQENCLQAARGDGPREFECRITRANGDTLWFHAYVQCADVGAVRAELSGLFVDITDQKRGKDSEYQLVYARDAGAGGRSRGVSAANCTISDRAVS